jgi:hypothetical protein
VVDVSVAMLFHQEGHLAQRAIQSLGRMLSKLRDASISYEVLATLDRADTFTTQIVEGDKCFSRIFEVNYLDPASCRNHLTRSSKGKYLAFLDGDDLWSANWLSAAYAEAETTERPALFHPDFVYYFFERDFDVHTVGDASPDALSHFVKHVNSSSAMQSVPLIDNLWSAHSFARRDVFEAHPFRSDDRELGLGIEDWSFNIETYMAGVEHLTVANTLHMVRVKEVGSQNQKNFTAGLLPWMHGKRN